MGKQKYPTIGGAITIAGERKQRDHTKTGKLAKRRETRRLEAIGRQVEAVQGFGRTLEKAEDKAEAQKAITHAQLTLQQIRGGMPHKELAKRFATKETNEKIESQTVSAQPSTKNSK